MRTLLVGAGSVGGTVAVFMKKNGYDVDLLVRSEDKAELLRSKGITISGEGGNSRADFSVYSSFEQLKGVYDFCIIATKYQQLVPVAKSILCHIGNESLVVAMQNGICIDMLSDVVGKERTVGCMIGFGATMKDATNIEMTSKGEFYIGMADGSHPKELDALKIMFESVLPTKTDDDIRARLYSKLIINSCINSLAAVSGKTLGELVSMRKACDMFLSIAREGYTVAESMNIKVPKYGALLDYRLLMLGNSKIYNSVCRSIIKLVAKAKYSDVRPSTLQSLERNQKTEIDIFNGYFAQKAEENGISAPVNKKLTSMIKEIENDEREITVNNIVNFSV